MDRHILLALFTSTIVSAGPASAEILVKDLRAQGSPSGLSVVLCARTGIPGHALVILAAEDEAKRACTIEAFGLYPQSATKAMSFGPVPGIMADEFLDGRGVDTGSCRIIVHVDPPLFARIEATRKKWAARGIYQLLEADCVTFTGEVAGTLGLKVPDRKDAKLPAAYVEKLYELNK